MEKEFVPYAEALELKKLGFDEPCFAFYYDKTKFLKLGSDPDHLSSKRKCSYIFGNEEHDVTLAPTFSGAFRWFREKYRLDGKSEYFLNDWYCFIINDMKGEDTSRRLFTEFPSYEEAELECLKKLIEIVNNK